VFHWLQITSWWTLANIKQTGILFQSQWQLCDVKPSKPAYLINWRGNLQYNTVEMINTSTLQISLNSLRQTITVLSTSWDRLTDTFSTCRLTAQYHMMIYTLSHFQRFLGSNSVKLQQIFKTSSLQKWRWMFCSKFHTVHFPAVKELSRSVNIRQSQSQINFLGHNVDH